MQLWTRPLLRQVLPDLADEIRHCLQDDDESDLADQVGSVLVWGRCPCGDDFCSSFYTGPRSRGPWSDEGEDRTIPLLGSSGMVNLDVVAGNIRYVEVLDRPDLALVVATFPPLDNPLPGSVVLPKDP